VDGVLLQIVDLEAVVGGVPRLDAVEEGHAAAQRHNQLVVRHLDLGGGLGEVHLGIAHPDAAHHLGPAGIGHVQDIHPGPLEGAAVHIVLIPGFVEGHLEGVDAVQIGEAHHLHVLDIALVGLAFRVKGHGHFNQSSSLG
jgi:hypothetical protein